MLILVQPLAMVRLTTLQKSVAEDSESLFTAINTFTLDLAVADQVGHLPLMSWYRADSFTNSDMTPKPTWNERQKPSPSYRN